MKRVFMLILVLTLVLGLAGCNNTSAPKQEDGKAELTLENYEEYLNISFNDFTINVAPLKNGGYENAVVKIRLEYPATYQISKPEGVVRGEDNRSATYTFELPADGKYAEAFDFVALFGKKSSEVNFSVASVSGQYTGNK